MLLILPGSLPTRSSPCLELSIIKIKIIVFEAHHILVLLHISSLSVRHRGRCPLHTRMTNINISYKYSNASHASFIIRFLFHMLQRKLRECKNWSQTCNLNLSPCSLSTKVVSLKDIKFPSFPSPISPSPQPHHLQSCSENREISSEMVPPSQKSHYSGMIPSAAAQVLFF